MVTAALHIPAMDQVGAATGDDVTTAHVHGNAYHPMWGHTTTGRGNHRGNMTSTSLRVKVGPATALPVQLSLGVVGVGCSSAERSQKLAWSPQESTFQLKICLEEQSFKSCAKAQEHSAVDKLRNCVDNYDNITDVMKIFCFA